MFCILFEISRQIGKLSHNIGPEHRMISTRDCMSWRCWKVGVCDYHLMWFTSEYLPYRFWDQLIPNWFTDGLNWFVFRFMKESVCFWMGRENCRCIKQHTMIWNGWCFPMQSTLAMQSTFVYRPNWYQSFSIPTTGVACTLYSLPCSCSPRNASCISQQWAFKKRRESRKWWGGGRERYFLVLLWPIQSKPTWKSQSCVSHSHIHSIMSVMKTLLST